MRLKGKYIETNLGNKGVVVNEYITYPEPSEWVLDNGYVMTEFSMYCNREHIILIKEIENND